MSFILPNLVDLANQPFDSIIDVRSPSEFAEDHVPGAMNLPVLSDEERAEVGTIYVQDSPFRARKLGAALVARNAACHLEGPLADRDGGWRPLVYCWRGGQRSGSFASILSQIGWRVEVLAGGYQSYRRAVVDMLYAQPVRHRIVLLDGHTGTGKTEVLQRIQAMGHQVLDLEGLANHRGSVLGPCEGGQPSQKTFESHIAMVLAETDVDLPLIVEAESSKVGERLVPPQLWTAMRRAPRIRLEAGPDDRAAYLARAYQDLTAEPDVLMDRLAKLLPFVGRERLGEWETLVQRGAFEALARDLIARHYDARYAKSVKHRPAEERISVSLSPDGLAAAARAVVEKAGMLETCTDQIG